MVDMWLEPFWDLITRLGEAQILLPTALLLAAWFAWRGHSRRLAVTWLLGIATATLVTTASKVAFIGYGVGWPALNFTGVSGHSMFAAAIYPLAGIAVASAVAGPQSISWQRVGLMVGVVLAIVVGVSRVAISAHSWSEVLLGLAVGGAASAMALWVERAADSPSAPVAAAGGLPVADTDTRARAGVEHPQPGHQPVAVLVGPQRALLSRRHARHLAQPAGDALRRLKSRRRSPRRHSGNASDLRGGFRRSSR